MSDRPLILVAPDSFKESLTATRAAEAIRRGVFAAEPQAEVVCLPLTDGGEGFVETLVAAGDGTRVREHVTGPLGEPVEATWGLIADGAVAVIEMAQAAGLERVPADRRDPTLTTSFGVGELIVAARARKPREILVGIGGSATNDGGLGMAQVLGFAIHDAEGSEIEWPAAGCHLGQVERVFSSSVAVAGDGAPPIRVACDVDNPLLGPRGAARTYAAQKGASPAQIESLEEGMAHFADVISRDLRIDVREMPGAGAAGGLGAGLVAFAGARLEPGAALVLDALRFDDHLERASLVVTGEGAVNDQTLRGKAPWEVCQRARARGIPTVLLAGETSRAPAALKDDPLVHVRRIAPDQCSREESMREAPRFLEEAARAAVSALLR